MSQTITCLKLETARVIAEQVCQVLRPVCERVEVAGSIRRRRPLVHDIDLVAIPNNQGAFLYALQSLGQVTGGRDIIKVALIVGVIDADAVNPVTLDVYIAKPLTWAGLMLIRTGSTRHNIMLCQRARELGYRLHADGSGIDNGDEIYTPETEQSFFNLLRLPYKPPSERE